MTPGSLWCDKLSSKASQKLTKSRWRLTDLAPIFSRKSLTLQVHYRLWHPCCQPSSLSFRSLSVDARVNEAAKIFFFINLSDFSGLVHLFQRISKVQLENKENSVNKLASEKIEQDLHCVFTVEKRQRLLKLTSFYMLSWTWKTRFW